MAPGTQQITNWASIATVRDHIDFSAQYVGSEAASDFARRATSMFACPQWTSLESPLGAIYFTWWLALAERNFYTNADLFVLNTQREVVIETQTYRLDFVLEAGLSFEEKLHAAGLSWPLIAVEVDGHAFHEKTPEQVELRNRRDRALQQEGWQIFHYSWSEVVRNPAECVSEVLLAGRAAAERLLTELSHVKR